MGARGVDERDLLELITVRTSETYFKLGTEIGKKLREVVSCH